jgi:predicted dehydrogenase
MGRAWYTDPALSGGGALVDQVDHVADLIDHLTGLHPERVYAAVNVILHSGRAAGTVETAGFVTITYQGGVIATIDCSWSQPDSAPIWGGLTFDIVGTGGQAAIEPFSQHLSGHSETDRNGLYIPYGVDTNREMIAEFINAIRERRQPHPDGAAGLRSLSIVLAAQESAQTGLPIDVLG